MYMYKYVYIYIHIYIYVHMYIYIYVYVYILGIIVNSIRRGLNCVENRDELQSMGFDFKSQQTRYGYPLIKRCLQVILLLI
jgi:hypothetical protein